MNAVALTGIGRFEMVSMPPPVIACDTDVLIRMILVGICGSDVHYYRVGRISNQVVKYPFVIGHEGVGIVQQVGSEVKQITPGDRIAIDPAIPCWECDQCLSGRFHTCRNLKFLGCPGQTNGCLSDYIVMPEKNCYKIKTGMTMEQAVLSEPLAIGIYSVKQSCCTKKMKIGILGAGTIGLSVLLAAKTQGVNSIYVTDKIDERVTVAVSISKGWAGNPDKEDIVEKIKFCEPDGLDIIFECCGEQEALDQAILLLKPGGKLVIIGIPVIKRVSFSIDDLRRKEISILNVRRQVNCTQAALDAIDSGNINVDFMVTHQFRPEQAKEAFELAADYRDGVIKAMIVFDE